MDTAGNFFGRADQMFDAGHGKMPRGTMIDENTLLAAKQFVERFGRDAPRQATLRAGE